MSPLAATIVVGRSRGGRRRSHRSEELPQGGNGRFLAMRIETIEHEMDAERSLVSPRNPAERFANAVPVRFAVACVASGRSATR
jgi:hypothetical protein